MPKIVGSGNLSLLQFGLGCSPAAPHYCIKKCVKGKEEEGEESPLLLHLIVGVRVVFPVWIARRPHLENCYVDNAKLLFWVGALRKSVVVLILEQ